MTGPSKAELSAMVEEATVDCYGEEEQLTGFACTVEENLEVPFKTTVLGITVTVTGVTHASHGLVADCVHAGTSRRSTSWICRFPTLPRRALSGSRRTGTGHARGPRG